MDLTLDYYFDLDGVPFRSIFAAAESVLDMKQCVQDHCATILDTKIEGTVSPQAFIEGPVHIEAGAVVEAGAMIQGPALICVGAFIRHGALVRDHSIIGPRCKVGHSSEIARSVLMSDCFATHFAFVGDSIIGSRVNIGSSCVFTNLIIDRRVAEPAVEPVGVRLHGEWIETPYTKFGAVIGDGSRTAAHISLGPGTLIGKNVVLHTRAQLSGNFPSGTQSRS